MKEYRTITACRSCGSRNLRKFFDLGRQPPANSLLKNPAEKEKPYSLSLSRCGDCGLIQLNETIDPKILFSRYLWVTGTSSTARAFARVFFRAAIARCPGFRPGRGYVLEVASNDGTFLLPFQERGFKVVGVDPAKNMASLARRNGIETRAVFFGEKAARALCKDYGQARLVIARNVLPHVANTRDFVAGLAAAAHPEGVVAVEAHWAKIILEGLHYDSIYHEHLCYFTFQTLERLLNQFGLFVFDVGASPISGGSLVAYASKQKRPEKKIVKTIRGAEARTRTNALTSWQRFAKRAIAHRRLFKALLRKEASGGKRIAGYGASARSSTLLNFCGIGPAQLAVIADQNPLKQRLWTAGSHIPIRNPGEVFEVRPDAVCILAWNFKDEIMREVKRRYGYRGPFLIPLPNHPYKA